MVNDWTSCVSHDLEKDGTLVGSASALMLKHGKAWEVDPCVRRKLRVSFSDEISPHPIWEKTERFVLSLFLIRVPRFAVEKHERPQYCS